MPSVLCEEGSDCRRGEHREIHAGTESGADGLYDIDAVGYYRGRSCPEKLITVFSQDVERYVEYFRQWFRENNVTLRQEALACEADGVWYIESL